MSLASAHLFDVYREILLTLNSCPFKFQNLNDRPHKIAFTFTTKSKIMIIHKKCFGNYTNINRCVK